MSYTLLSSLTRFTDFRFRNAQNKKFLAELFYAPYIRLNGKWLSSRLINVIYYRKIITLEVIPQIITNDADEFLFVSKYV
jgi:hypothetical protein